jgi:hypothetical protein
MRSYRFQSLFPLRIVTNTIIAIVIIASLALPYIQIFSLAKLIYASYMNQNEENHTKIIMPFFLFFMPFLFPSLLFLLPPLYLTSLSSIYAFTNSTFGLSFPLDRLLADSFSQPSRALCGVPHPSLDRFLRNDPLRPLVASRSLHRRPQQSLTIVSFVPICMCLDVNVMVLPRVRVHAIAAPLRGFITLFLSV